MRLTPFGSVAGGTKPILMENAKHNRDHDGFLKFVYSVPENVHSFFNIASKTNENLAAMLSEVDLTTLEEIPEAYNEVRERGEADVAFKVKAVTGEDVFFGILLEHKSWPDDTVFSQIYRYVFKVMVNKNGDVFPWMSTKAVIIYNGSKEWDPFKRLAERHRAKFQNRILPFECVFVNLAKINDKNCLEESNAEAGVAALTMKYAFDAEGFEKLLPQIAEMLKKLDKSRAACLVEKIELYLGEFFSQNAREALEMAVKSIGGLYGFVSVNDAIRAEERKRQEEERCNLIKKNLQKGKTPEDVSDFLDIPLSQVLEIQQELRNA